MFGAVQDSKIIWLLLFQENDSISAVWKCSCTPFFRWLEGQKWLFQSDFFPGRRNWLTLICSFGVDNAPTRRFHGGSTIPTANWRRRNKGISWLILLRIFLFLNSIFLSQLLVRQKPLSQLSWRGRLFFCKVNIMGQCKSNLLSISYELSTYTRLKRHFTVHSYT